DPNSNGVQDAGEPGIAGVTLVATGTNDLGQNVSVVTTSGTDGTYTFGNLRPGFYNIAETQPAGYISTINTPGMVDGKVTGKVVDDTIVNIDLRSCNSGVGFNFGECKQTPPANSISGYVYQDCNGNGIREAGEEAIPGVTITLDSPTGGTAVTTTDANGKYE